MINQFAPLASIMAYGFVSAISLTFHQTLSIETQFSLVPVHRSNLDKQTHHAKLSLFGLVYKLLSLLHFNEQFHATTLNSQVLLEQRLAIDLEQMQFNCFRPYKID